MIVFFFVDLKKNTQIKKNGKCLFELFVKKCKVNKKKYHLRLDSETENDNEMQLFSKPSMGNITRIQNYGPLM